MRQPRSAITFLVRERRGVPAASAAAEVPLANGAVVAGLQGSISAGRNVMNEHQGSYPNQYRSLIGEQESRRKTRLRACGLDVWSGPVPWGRHMQLRCARRQCVKGRLLIIQLFFGMAHRGSLLPTELPLRAEVTFEDRQFDVVRTCTVCVGVSTDVAYFKQRSESVYDHRVMISLFDSHKSL